MVFAICKSFQYPRPELCRKMSEMRMNTLKNTTHSMDGFNFLEVSMGSVGSWAVVFAPLVVIIGLSLANYIKNKP